MNLTSLNTLGEWVIEIPAAKYVFVKYGLDFCCGGGNVLKQSCSDLSLDCEEILNEIAHETSIMTKQEPRWSEFSLNELVDRILESFHNKHREDLKVLIPMAQKVESVHSDHPDVPKGLSDFLVMLNDELESHMQKEEQILFPMIQAGQGAMTGGPINVMMHEHIDHGENLKQLKILAKDFKLPEDACGSWNFLYKVLENFSLDVKEHISIENNLLFPKALC